MEDKRFTCCDCKKEFTWTTKDQQFFKDNKIDKEPIRCRDCAIILRDKRKKQEEKEKKKNSATTKPDAKAEKTKIEKVTTENKNDKK